MFAVETFAAGGCEGRDDQIAFFECLDSLADFGDSACEFVAHDEVGS
jgi:hypothetical protein